MLYLAVISNSKRFEDLHIMYRIKIILLFVRLLVTALNTVSSDLEENLHQSNVSTRKNVHNVYILSV